MRCLLLTLTLLTQNAFAGWYVGNGGDAIECVESSKNNLNGTYALDYILTLQDPKADDGLASVTSWKDSSERIMKLLINKAPTLVPSFKDFSRQVYNTSFSQTRVWEPAPFGLIKLDDQRVTSILPENCRGAGGDFQIMQAVIRQHEDFSGTERDHYVYKYFPDLLKRLETQSPLQLSFLMVHEWLWDLSGNVDRNRRISRFLHSREIETMTAAEVEATLKGMGFNLPEKEPDAFDGDLWTGYPVTQKQFFERFKNDVHMANLAQLTVDQRQKDANCEDGDLFCHPDWRKSPTPYYLNESRARFFLSPSWRFTSEKEYPIKIVSPELIAADGKSLLPGMGEIECRFVENVDPSEGNLECRFQNPRLINALFNLYSVDQLPMSRWPKMKGNLTEDCFRLLVRSTRTIDDIKDGRSTDTKQIVETVFTARFRWKP